MTHPKLAAGILFLFAAVALTSCGGGDEATPVVTMDSLVTAAWLSEHLDDPDMVVLECTVLIGQGADGSMTSSSGRPAFATGHIPTAGFADLTSDLCDPDSPLGYAMPSPERFCEVMGALGVGDDTRVVLYDRYRSVWAARVWWMLKWAGFDNAALLDGGLGAWTADDRPLSKEPATEPTRTLTPDPRPRLIADLSEVTAAIDDDAVALVDAMPEPHYLGQMVMYDRPGHIPTAVNVSSMTLLDENGRFLSEEQLAEVCGDDHATRHIIYCGGGIAASANAFILDRLGFEDVAVYTASLQEWAADPTNPLEVD